MKGLNPSFPYPESPKEAISENYFGTEVPDPYRWLEEEQTPRTRQWMTQQNRLTREVLDALPSRPAIHRRLSTLWNYTQYSPPERHGEYLYLFIKEGLQPQSVLWRCRHPEEPLECFLDPNHLSDHGTCALTAHAFSPDSRYMAYAMAESGSDWSTLRIRDTTTGQDLPDQIHWVKFACAVWCGEGFYYSGYEAPAEGLASHEQTHGQQLYYHRLGTPQSADRLLYADPSHPLRYLHPAVDREGRWLVLMLSEGTSGVEVRYGSTEGAEPLKTLFAGFDHDYTWVGGEADKIWLHTNQGAPNGRIIEVSLAEETPVVRELIASTPEEPIEWVHRVGSALFVGRLREACSVVSHYALDGALLREVKLPGEGTVTGFEPSVTEASACYYGYTDYTHPTELYRYDPTTGSSSLLWRPELPFDPASWVTERQWVSREDGTRLLVSLVYRRGLQPSSETPLYLYGYGGFNINLTPTYSPLARWIAEQDGIYAVATLRGGGEFGEAWHRAGMLEQKQNVFDDFIALAEHLIAIGYTSSRRLALAGTSNGGLLVGACMTQRPDLFAVALPSVGVLDMLRYHRFTVGWGWIVEYGSAEDPTQFPTLYRYSPLHRIRQGCDYPATLITTGDHDDRVVPAHSLKFAATLQQAQGGAPPILLRIETEAGHGLGKPTAKRIDEQTDQMAFMMWNMGLKA